MDSLAFPALRKAGDFLCGYIKAAGAAGFIVSVQIFSEAVRRPSDLENRLTKFQVWRGSE